MRKLWRLWGRAMWGEEMTQAQVQGYVDVVFLVGFGALIAGMFTSWSPPAQIFGERNPKSKVIKRVVLALLAVPVAVMLLLPFGDVVGWNKPSADAPPLWTHWVATLFLAVVPILLAGARISESVDIENGLEPAERWKGLGRALPRAAGLIVVTVPAWVAGVVIIRVTVLTTGLANNKPGWSWDDFLWALPLWLAVLLAWGLAEKLMMRGTRRAGRAGASSLIDRLADARRRSWALVQAVFYFAGAALVLAANSFWWRWIGGTWDSMNLTAWGVNVAATEKEVITLVAYALAVYLASKGAVQCWHGLKGIERGGADIHGKADLADLPRAIDAAAGHGAPETLEGLDVNY